MSPPCVLVVEDNDDLRDLFCMILTNAGFRVASARHGLEAWSLLPRIACPDAFVLDLMMPVFDGWSLADVLRSRPDTKDAAIVAVSAHRPERESRGAIDAFLPKPFEPAELVDVVRRTLDARATPLR